MDKWQEFHLLSSDDLVNQIVISIVIHVCEVLISSNKRLLTQLIFKVYSKSFNSISHRVGCLNTR